MIYKCDNCNAVIDRDKNASINLYNYGKSIAQLYKKTLLI